MIKSRLIGLSTFADERGFLTILENEIDFLIKRIFWIYGADGQIRGGHRHKITRQALIAIQGKININIKRKDCEKNFFLNEPSKCLIIEPEDWHTMEFSENGILLVVASQFFDKNDYINDYLK